MRILKETLLWCAFHWIHCRVDRMTNSRRMWTYFVEWDDNLCRVYGLWQIESKEEMSAVQQASSFPGSCELPQGEPSHIHKVHNIFTFNFCRLYEVRQIFFCSHLFWSQIYGAWQIEKFCTTPTSQRLHFWRLWIYHKLNLFISNLLSMYCNFFTA